MKYSRAIELAEMFPTVVKRQFVGDYELMDYWFADWAMFRDYPETREFRGITYDRRDGSIVSRPMHKFFNIGQVDETSNLEIEGWLSEKRDGSMVQATYHDGELFVASRSSMSGYVNEVATPLFTEGLKDYLAAHSDYTFLFELEDKNHSIVLKHSETKLVYLMARHKVSGEYEFDLWPPEVDGVVYKHVYPESWDSFKEEAEENRMEGWVVWVNGYGPVKWKTPWYMESHGLVTEHTPKKWVQFWAKDDVDDVLALLRNLGHEERVEELENFASTLNAALFDTIGRAYELAEGSETVKDCAISTQEIRDEPFGPLVFSHIMKDARCSLPLRWDAPGLMARVKESLEGGKVADIAEAYYEKG